MSRKPNRLPSLIEQGYGNTIVLPMVADIVSQGTWTCRIELEQMLSLVYQNSSHSDGDSSTFYVTLSKGIYTVRILHIKSSVTGIVYFDLDSINIGSIDNYAASISYNEIYTIPNLNIVTTGIKKFRIRINGKNAESNNYYTHLTMFNFIKQA